MMPVIGIFNLEFKCMACGHLNEKKLTAKSANPTDYGEPVPIEFQQFPLPQQTLSHSDGFNAEESFPAIEQGAKTSSRPSSSGDDNGHDRIESVDTESDAFVPKRLDTDMISENMTESSGTKSPPSLRKKKKKTKSTRHD
jgi:hypothetical protein